MTISDFIFLSVVSYEKNTYIYNVHGKCQLF